MAWQALHDLDSFLHHSVAQRAQVDVLGHSPEGRALTAVQIGPPAASLTVVVIAGFHATEIAGPLAAIQLIDDLLKHPPMHCRFAILPIADPDRLIRNLANLPAEPSAPDLLKLGSVEDLEGVFTTPRFVECQDIRRWLEHFEQIDGYYSLHTAHRVAPGLFFYVAGSSMSVVGRCLAQQLANTLPTNASMLTHDPTGLATQLLAPGILMLPIVGTTPESPMHESSLAFVVEHFDPQIIGVTEVPLGLCLELGQATLTEIEIYNQVLAQTGQAPIPYQPFTLAMQRDLILSFFWAGVQCLSPASQTT